MNLLYSTLSIFTLYFGATQAAICWSPPPIGGGATPPPCGVGNIRVTSTRSGDDIVPISRCGLSVNRTELDGPPVVRITQFSPNLPRNQTFFLVSIDVTTNQLLWMISNITVFENKLTTGYGGPLPNSINLYPYRAPNFINTNTNHTILYYIFEEKLISPNSNARLSNVNLGSNRPFSLTQWMEEQYSSGTIILCGPVSGGQIVAQAKLPQHPNNGPSINPPYSPPNNNNYYPYNPNTNQKPKNGSDKIGSNNLKIGFLVVVFAYAFCK